MGNRAEITAERVTESAVCALDGQPAQRCVELYIDGERREVPVCDACIARALRGSKTGVLFCLVMQLLWFLPARSGLLSMPGIVGAVVATVFLVRLLLLLAARLAVHGIDAAGEGASQIPDWVWRYGQGQVYAQELARDELAEKLDARVETPLQHERAPRPSSDRTS